MNILTWDSIGYRDLLFVSLARMRGKNSFGLALNQSVIIVFVAMNVAADARHLFQVATKILDRIDTTGVIKQRLFRFYQRRL